MCDDEALGFAVGSPYKIHAIRIMGGGDFCFGGFGDDFLNHLAQSIIDADVSKVLACDADKTVGWHGRQGERRALFLNAVGAFIIKRNGVDAKVGVDEDGAVNVLLAFDGWRCKYLKLNGFSDGDNETRIGDVVAFVEEFDNEMLGPATVDDEFLGSVVGDGHWLTVWRAAVEVEVDGLGADDDAFFAEAVLCAKAEAKHQRGNNKCNEFFHCYPIS